MPSASTAVCSPCDVPPVGHVGAVWEDAADSEGEESSWTFRDMSSVGGFTITVQGSAVDTSEADDDEALAAQGIYTTAADSYLIGYLG